MAQTNAVAEAQRLLRQRRQAEAFRERGTSPPPQRWLPSESMYSTPAPAYPGVHFEPAVEFVVHGSEETWDESFTCAENPWYGFPRNMAGFNGNPGFMETEFLETEENDEAWQWAWTSQHPSDAFHASDSSAQQSFSSGPAKKHAEVAKEVDFMAEFAKTEGENITTLMLRSMPRTFTRRKLMHLLDSHGFAGTYDFVYIPVDSATNCSVGYAFVNFEDPDTASEFKAKMFGYAFPGYKSTDPRDSRKRTMHISTAYLQGVERNLEHFRSSASLSASSASRPWFKMIDQAVPADGVDELPEAASSDALWWAPTLNESTVRGNVQPAMEESLPVPSPWMWGAPPGFTSPEEVLEAATGAPPPSAPPGLGWPSQDLEPSARAWQHAPPGLGREDDDEDEEDAAIAAFWRLPSPTRPRPPSESQQAMPPQEERGQWQVAPEREGAARVEARRKAYKAAAEYMESLQGGLEGPWICNSAEHVQSTEEACNDASSKIDEATIANAHEVAISRPPSAASRASKVLGASVAPTPSSHRPREQVPKQAPTADETTTEPLSIDQWPALGGAQEKTTRAGEAKRKPKQKGLASIVRKKLEKAEAEPSWLVPLRLESQPGTSKGEGKVHAAKGEPIQ